MDNSITPYSKEQMKALDNASYYGHDMGSNNVYPSVVNILQSDKQFVAFGDDGGNITTKMYGSLFIRSDENKLSDLVETMTFTMLKVERGWEAYGSDNKLVESGLRTLNGERKESMEQDLGGVVKNMVKVLVTPYSYDDTMKMLSNVAKKSENGEAIKKTDYPFCLVVVKGSGWENWLGAEKEMKEIARASLGRSIDKTPVVAFKMTMGSDIREGDKGKYFVPTFKIELNSGDEASKFIGLLPDLKEESLFYKVKERITQEDKPQEGEVVSVEEEIFNDDKLIEGKQEAKEMSKEIVHDDPDLNEIDEELPF
jgi:hypothetical protein